MSDVQPLSEHVREKIEHWKNRFPEEHQSSAIIGALHAVQHENGGYLTPGLMDAVAEYLDLPNIHVYEVATSYSMFQTKPVGRHNVAICTNVSCMLRGADDIIEHVEFMLGVKLGETTADGRMSTQSKTPTTTSRPIMITALPTAYPS